MSKKIVFIVVLIECILAVLLISVFGQAIYDASPKPVSDVYFTYENGDKIEDGVRLNVELRGGNISYQLHWTVEPENAENSSVRFTSSKPNDVSVDENGLVTFFKVVDVTIIVSALDGSNKTDSIVLLPDEK